MKYNSQRPDLILPEYGRNIQNMVTEIKSIENREERNKATLSIIKIMGQLFPYLRNMDEFQHKLWDHLHIMSNYELDVDAPYPPPSKESFSMRPEPLNYPQGKIKYGHYGKTIERIIEAVANETDEEKREKQTLGLANLMKRTYLIWNRDSVKDEVIAKQLHELSNGKLELKNPSELDATADILSSIGSKNTGNSPRRKGKGKNTKRRKRR